MPTFGKVTRPWMKSQSTTGRRWNSDNPAGVPKNFYRCAPWRRLRQRQLEKQPLCEECLKKKKLEPATVVDHITPVRFGGGALDPDNLNSLCISCHNSKSAREGSS